MELSIKQTLAIDILEDSTTKNLIFGGGAGSAKSILGCYWVLKMCMKYPGVRGLIGRKKLKTLKESTLVSFFKVCKMQNIIKDVHFKFNLQSNTITFTNGSEILLKDLAYYPSDPEYDELGSLELTFAFIDECNQVPQIAFDIVRSRLRHNIDENGLIPKILGTCNPAKNWCYKQYYKPQKDGTIDPDKRFLQALVTDNPYIDTNYIKNLEGLPRAQRDRLLLGIWEIDDTNALIEYDNILNVFTNSHVVDPTQKKYITCDVARMGSDKAVIMVWRGLEVIEIYSYDISRINELQATIIALKSKHSIGNSNIVIDEDGVGGGLVDFIKGSRGFVNNSRSLGEGNYQNLKTQCYYRLAEMVQNNQIYISAEIDSKEEESIIQELEQIKSSDTDNDGKLKIISKAEVKLLINRSPDYTDAMAMRMIFEIGVKEPVNLRNKFGPLNRMR